MRRTTWFPGAIALFLLLLLALPGARIARADADATARADVAFTLAQAKEQALELAEALHAYELAESLAPQGPHAAAARARATFLRAHAEGEFAPLVALERVRREPARASDPSALGELGTRSRSFPEGLVRVETWLFLAVAYARLHDDADTVTFARLATQDPAADDISRTEAASLLAETCLRRGDATCAVEAARTKGVSDEVRARVERLVRRGRLVVVATLLLAVTVVGSLLLVVRSRARLTLPALRELVRPALSALVISAGGLIASSFDGASPLRFFLLGGAVMLLAVLAGRVASVARGAAVLRAASFALAVVAAAFLSLYASGPDYLTDFGL